MENYINLKFFFRNLPLIQFHSSFNRIITENGRVYSSEVHEGPPVLVWEVWSGIWKILHQSCSFRVQNKVKNDLNSFESRFWFKTTNFSLKKLSEKKHSSEKSAPLPVYFSKSKSDLSTRTSVKENLRYYLYI